MPEGKLWECTQCGNLLKSKHHPTNCEECGSPYKLESDVP
ncbi:DUF7129 domain-containing putative zinc-binding protein [Halorhabdus salina]